jgi:mono/diheme cytochrome c family protein
MRPTPGLIVLAASALGCAAASCASSKREPPAPPSAAVSAPAPTPAVVAPPAASEDTDVPEGDEEPAALDGRGLYLRHCAGCHNENGDGQGPTILALNQKARSFAQGGFAFGNTREAIYKTITAGMPGSSVMPSFRGVMSDDERYQVVDFVLTLTPKSEAAAKGTVMVVGAKPVIARGKLPSIAEGKPERPRGLLIGLPEGLTFEYRTDDVRLLGVRQGEFADRTDWNDRGGGELVPLGRAFALLDGGDPGETFAAIDGETRTPLRAQLASTWTRGGAAGIDYVLRAPDGREVALVSESISSESLSTPGAFTRWFQVSCLGVGTQFELRPAGSIAPSSRETELQPAECTSKTADGRVRREKRFVVAWSVDDPSAPHHWWLAWRTPSDDSTAPPPTLRLAHATFSLAAGQSIELRATLLTASEPLDARAEELAEELCR